jgi:PKD repeat protein
MIEVKTAPLSITGMNLHVAFWYQSAGNRGGITKRAGVDDICVKQVSGPLMGSFQYVQLGGELNFISNFTGGVFPYDYAWDFGNGETSTKANPIFTFSEAGDYQVT